MNLGNALWFFGVVTEAALVGLLIYRRIWRTFPFFFAYCIWDICMNLGIFAIMRLHPTAYTTNLYFAITVVDSVMQFSVLVEIAWAVLRPLRAYLSLKTLAVLILLLLATGAVIWPFAAVTNASQSNFDFGGILQIQHTVSFLRILFFLALASSSQLLSLGWRNRELQIATGFGIFSMVSLAVTAIRPAGASGDFYQMLNSIVIGSFICCLLYWFVSFARQEAARQEFSPQMRELLLSVASAARTTRVALQSSRNSDSNAHSDR